MSGNFVLLALCVITVQAAIIQPSDNYEPMLQDIFAQAKVLELHKQKLLQRHYERIPMRQIQWINVALSDINSRCSVESACAEKILRSAVSAILDNMFDEQNVCQAATQKDALKTIENLSLVISEILVDAYELTLLYQKCEAYTANVHKGLCFTRFSIKILSCVNELRLTIKSIVQNSEQRFDAIAAASDDCETRTINSAVLQLQSLDFKSLSAL